MTAKYMDKIAAKQRAELYYELHPGSPSAVRSPKLFARSGVWVALLGRSVGVMAAGVIIGLALAWAGGRLVSAQLFDVTARDPRVFAGAALTLLLVGGVAAWLPARRAARIDPTTALRAE